MDTRDNAESTGTPETPVTKQRGRRQLTAIMFTDIAGYTALMQTDEARGIKCLLRYKTVLQETVAQNGGEILQHFGDGSLTMFQSAVQAVQCAITLQRTLQEEPIVPLRAGMHLGDVVIESESVYGDGVNVASRIEQLADPGSILISQALYDSIRNHRKFRVKYLGAPKLRNVMEPTKVYAIRNRGIVVPDRLTKRVTVDLHSVKSTGALAFVALVFIAMLFGLTKLFGNRDSVSRTNVRQQLLPELVINQFQNHTGDPELDGLGRLASTQIARQLNANHLVYVRTREHLESSTYYELSGGYFKDHDVIVFQSILSDGKTGQVKTVFDPQVSRISDPAEGIDALAEQVMGYWPVKDQLHTGNVRSPKYSAYLAYQKGLEILYTAPGDAVNFFSEAIEIDREYLAPGMGNVHACYLNHDYASAKAELLRIKKGLRIGAHDRQMLSHWELLLQGEHQRSFDTLSHLLNTHPDPTLVRMQLANIAINHLRQPRTALNFITPLLKENAVHDPNVLILYQRILMKLRRYESVVAVTENSILGLTDAAVLEAYVRALCRLESDQQVRKLAEDCKNARMPFSCRADQIMHWAATEYALIGDTVSKQKYVSLGLGMPSVSNASEAQLHFLGGHFSTAAAMYRQEMEQSTDTLSIIEFGIRQAIAQANNGDSTLVTYWQDTLASWNLTHLPGLRSYHQARLFSALGDHEQAIEQLETAIRQGVPFANGFFETDPLLLPVMRDHRFLRMTEARD